MHVSAQRKKERRRRIKRRQKPATGVDGEDGIVAVQQEASESESLADWPKKILQPMGYRDWSVGANLLSLQL